MPSTFVNCQILLSVLSILWIIFAYYGYSRYWSLQIFSSEKYAKKYLELPRANQKNKIIVSLSTSNGNFELLKPTINSILDQTVHADQIIISTPPNTNLKNIPEFLKENRIIVVHALSKNYGESSCFLSPLLREKDGDAIIICISGQTVYGPDFIETILGESQMHPDKVIFITGYKAKTFLANGKKVDEKNENDIVSVSDGILIKPKFFHEDIFEYTKNFPFGIENTPDIYLSNYLHTHHIPITQVSYNENFSKFSTVHHNSHKNLLFLASNFPSI